MMKKLFLLLVLFAAHQGVNAQSALEKKANKLFDSYAYSEAIPLYQKLIAGERRPDLFYKLAECQRLTTHYEEAAKVYEELTYMVPDSSFYYVNYGQTLKVLGDYNKAKLYFRRYLIENPDGPDASDMIALIRSCEVYEDLQNNPLRLYIRPTTVSSPVNDFSPIIFNNNILYCSSKRYSLSDKTYSYDNQGFINLIAAPRESKTQFGEPLPLPDVVNGEFHEGPSIYSPRFKTMFLTRNNITFDKKENRYLNHLKIYYSNRVNDEWQQPKAFQLNNDRYSIGHPAIPPSGEVFYFVSDMPGGEGQTDIYRCELGNGGWSAPVNMGPRINTAGKEMFPFAYNDTLLFFASGRLVGLGGLDIYKAILDKDGEVKEVINLGAPVNSRYDDFGFFLENEETFSGYFSSNRPGGEGGDDIYFFEKVSVNLFCFVVDSATYEPINLAKVASYQNASIENSQFTSKKGQTKLMLSPGSTYEVVVSRPGYKSKRFSLELENMSRAKDSTIVVELVKGDEERIKGLVFDAETLEPLANTRVFIESTEGKSRSVVTNSGGQFVFNGLDPVKYNLKVTKEGYFGYSESLGIPDDSRYYRVPLSKGKQGSTLSEMLQIDPIYYDYDKWDITPRSAKILDTIIVLMNENPSMILEMVSHTDLRGTDEYNLELSRKRVESALTYMTSRGIDRVRFRYSYVGENDLKVPCPEGVDCTEDIHWQNRRTEFEVISF